MKTKTAEQIVNLFIHIILLFFSIACIIPFILTFIVSISDEKSVIMKGYSFFPDKFSMAAYSLVFTDNTVINAYGVTIIVTLTGTLLSVTACALAGYAMSIKKVKHRNKMAMFFYIPMVFSAGLVPWYLVVAKTLALKDTIFALILPGMISPFNIFLLRNYFTSLPPSLAESAEIDGASRLKTFFKIILPLSTPIVATIILFVSLYYWNDWICALWFVDNKKLFPLQYMLYRIQSLILYLKSNGGQATGSTGNLPMQTVQVATLFVTIGPIILVYPFIQKYFIRGIMIGAIKG